MASRRASGEFLGRGLEYYVAQFEKPEADFVEAQACIARLGPDDPAVVALGQKALRSMRAVMDVQSDVERERNDFVTWSRASANAHWVVGSLFPGVAQQAIDLAEDTANRYEALSEILEEALVEWWEWFDTTFPREPYVENGLRICSAGHQNHISRESCAICAEYLL